MNYTDENFCLDKIKLEMCKLFPVATMVNPNLVSKPQRNAYYYYNAQVAKSQKRLLEAKSEDELPEIFKEMASDMKHIGKIFHLIKTNPGIPKLFDFRLKLLKAPNVEDALFAQYDYLYNEILGHNEREKSLQETPVDIIPDYEKDLMRAKMLCQKELLDLVIDRQLESFFGDKVSPAWDMGFNSVEFQDLESTDRLESVLKHTEDVASTLGAKKEIMGLNGLLGISLREYNKDDLASFNPTGSQMIIHAPEGVESNEVDKSLSSTILHEWTHAVDIISVEQGYPQYQSSVSGQIKPESKIVKILKSYNTISNNDFIPVIKALEDMTVNMVSKNPSELSETIENHHRNVVHKFYQKSLKENWMDLNAEQRKELDGPIMKDIVVKWLASNYSKVIKGTLIDLLIPVLGNDKAAQVSYAMDSLNFENLKLNANNTDSLKLDSEYYNRMHKQSMWNVKKMKMKAFLFGDAKAIDEVKAWESLISSPKQRKYYAAPEEMLARQMEATFYPKEILKAKESNAVSSLVYPEGSCEDFKVKAKNMVELLEKACGLNDNVSCNIADKIQQFKKDSAQLINPTKNNLSK